MRPKNGVIVTAIAERDSWDVCFSNNVGGTSSMPKGRYRVRVVTSWHDYETGDVIHGELLNKRDINKAKKIGMTKFTAKDYNYAADVVEAEKKFMNPPIIFFRKWQHPKVDQSIVVGDDDEQI